MTYRPDLRPVADELSAAGLLSDGGARRWANRGRSRWQELARSDSRLATVFSAYVATTVSRGMAIQRERPGAFDRERVRVLAEAGVDDNSRKALTRLLIELWDHVPYAADPAARLDVLAWARPRSHFSRRHWGEIVALAAMLAESTGPLLPSSYLPARLRLPGDDAVLQSSEVAARAVSASNAELEQLAPVLLTDPRLQRFAEQWGPARFLRRLMKSSSLGVAMLLHSDYLSLRTPTVWDGVRATWDAVDDLIRLLRAPDDDPFAACRGGRRMTVTDEVLERFEHLRLLDYERRGVGDLAAWDRTYRGCTGLQEMLRVLDPDKDGVIVERPPWFPPRPGRRGTPVDPDTEQLDLSTQAELFVFGVRVLASSPERLRTWVVAWATICRSKESLPFREDLVPLPGGGIAIHQERAASKNGANETCASAPAVAATGLSPSWFTPRPPRRLYERDYETHAEVFRDACRAVRAAWGVAGGCELPDQLSYFVRHAGADRMREALSGRHHVLTRILRHLSAVSDYSYTLASESERAVDLEGLAHDLGDLLP